MHGPEDGEVAIPPITSAGRMLSTRVYPGLPDSGSGSHLSAQR
jgi:hypothetical protein